MLHKLTALVQRHLDQLSRCTMKTGRIVQNNCITVTHYSANWISCHYAQGVTVSKHIEGGVSCIIAVCYTSVLTHSTVPPGIPYPIYVRNITIRMANGNRRNFFLIVE